MLQDVVSCLTLVAFDLVANDFHGRNKGVWAQQGHRDMSYPVHDPPRRGQDQGDDPTPQGVPRVLHERVPQPKLMRTFTYTSHRPVRALKAV